MTDSSSAPHPGHIPHSQGADRPWEAFESTLATSDDAVFAKKSCGTLIYANRSFIKKFATGDQPEGRKTSEVLPKEVQAIAEYTDKLVLDSKHPALFSFECAFMGKPRRRYNTLKFPLLDERDEVGMILGISYCCDGKGKGKERWKAIDVETLRRATRVVESLPPVQRSALRLVAHGFINKQVAKLLEVSVRSIENYRSKCIKLLGVHSSAELGSLITTLEHFGIFRDDDSMPQ